MNADDARDIGVGFYRGCLFVVVIMAVVAVIVWWVVWA